MLTNGTAFPRRKGVRPQELKYPLTLLQIGFQNAFGTHSGHFMQFPFHRLSKNKSCGGSRLLSEKPFSCIGPEFTAQSHSQTVLSSWMYSISLWMYSIFCAGIEFQNCSNCSIKNRTRKQWQIWSLNVGQKTQTSQSDWHCLNILAFLSFCGCGSQIYKCRERNFLRRVRLPGFTAGSTPAPEDVKWLSLI